MGVPILSDYGTPQPLTGSDGCQTPIRLGSDGCQTPACPRLPVIAELQRNAEVVRPEGRHRVLQLVFRRRGDPHLVGLD